MKIYASTYFGARTGTRRDVSQDSLVTMAMALGSRWPSSSLVFDPFRPPNQSFQSFQSFQSLVSVHFDATPHSPKDVISTSTSTFSCHRAGAVAASLGETGGVLRRPSPAVKFGILMVSASKGLPQKPRKNDVHMLTLLFFQLTLHIFFSRNYLK